MAIDAADPIDATSFVTLDELQPRVDLAACYHRLGPERYRYRVPGQHFLLVTAGRIDATTPSGRTEGRTGDLLCFPAADLNEYGMDEPTDYYEAHIRFAPPPRHRHAVWLDEVGPVPLRVRLGDGYERMRRIFDTLCCELPLSGAVHRARVVGAVWDMLGVIAESVRPAKGNTGGAAPMLDVWQRSRMRLASDLGGKLEIRAIAVECDMSVDHFIRGFRRRFGISPGHYRAQQKLRHAAHRLRAGDEPIKALAHELGFADAYSFTRAFRKYLGVLPSDLRSGRAIPSAEQPPDQGLMTVNAHILPPDAGTDIYAECTPVSWGATAPQHRAPRCPPGSQTT